MPTSPARRANAIVGDYELTRPLGEGGMGQVYLARDRRTGVEVVLKRMHAERANDPAFRRRFQTELQTMTRFRHPGAIALLDASHADAPEPFLVLEYIHGITLHELLETEGRLPVDRVARLLGPLCTVLHAAHAQGILHRDLTPANLMIVNPGSTHESITVMDFGLARLGSGFFIEAENLQNDDGGIGGGTPDYVCPEQVRGETVDGRGDLYSLGVVLYRALTGHLPFEAVQQVADIVLAHRDHAPPCFADIGMADVPPAIEAVVRSCLAKLPAERPQSAQELAERFGAALGRPIVDAAAFAAPPAALAETEPDFAPETILDRFEAGMPEQIAVMKLRGFIHGVGGTVAESNPGLIRVRLPAVAGKAPPTGFWSWLRSAASPTPAQEMIELHLHQHAAAGRSQVEIVVVRPDGDAETHVQRQAGREHCRAVCRELRAYLMIGR